VVKDMSRVNKKIDELHQKDKIWIRETEGPEDKIEYSGGLNTPLYGKPTHWKPIELIIPPRLGGFYVHVRKD
jgi:hypothetical protein